MTLLFVTSDPSGKMIEVDVLYKTNIPLSKIRVQRPNNVKIESRYRRM